MTSRVHQPPIQAETDRERELIKRYTEMDAIKERKSAQETKNSGTLALVYVIDWENEWIGAVEKSLRIEIGMQTGAYDRKFGITQISHEWP